MSWLEFSLTVPAEQQQRVEAALEDLGALSITLQDADAETPDERAIFEPGVGETPLWASIVVQALFEAQTDRAGLVHGLADLVPELAPAQVLFREVAEQDWTRAWMDQFQPMRFGRRLWIYPWNVEPADDDVDAVVVRLDPGLAFGTGTHPTTALCLEWLDAADVVGKTVIDFGCGSGVLAIAALKLGAARVIGVDNDAQALVASRMNAERNGVIDRLDLHLADAAPSLRGDILLANILAGPLHELAEKFSSALPANGCLVLSGILNGQETELLSHYARWFRDLRVDRRNEWIRISASRL
jgi:ribosomal protein L11 methyltransferase